ncbi:hypothetical protein GA0061071_11275 [Kosakonia oryzendophytica]|uniref:DUF3592 domain-containing protein n=1 Tax=Kosakonia oryzendophytica TaxID=1005665 RepID=A0A1C4DH22_9ENTR|nr:DUF3592 domain-containing protein [Kosakonia oryzendophytica]SCC30684.1 hypothetical protein GA0061071_11275 [Kosakonia oryzendophytica]
MEFDWMYIIYLFFAVVFILIIKGFYSFFGGYIKQMFVEARVMKIGIGVNADIIHRSKTALIDAEMPVYRLTVKFRTHEGVEVQSSIDRALDMDGFTRYAPGNGVALKYDPKNPKRIALYDNDKPLILGD